MIVKVLVILATLSMAHADYLSSEGMIAKKIMHDLQHLKPTEAQAKLLKSITNVSTNAEHLKMKKMGIQGYLVSELCKSYESNKTLFSSASFKIVCRSFNFEHGGHYDNTTRQAMIAQLNVTVIVETRTGTRPPVPTTTPTPAPAPTTQPAPVTTQAPATTTSAPTIPSRRTYHERLPPMSFIDSKVSITTLAQVGDHLDKRYESQTAKCPACITGPSLKADSKSTEQPNFGTAERYLMCHGRLAQINSSLAIPNKPQDCITDSQAIRALYYKDASFTKIAANALSKYPELDTLIIKGGKLETLDLGAFSGTKYLGLLDLSMNSLTGFDLRVLSGQYSLKYVNLTGNKINCDKVCVDRQAENALSFNEDVHISGTCRNYTNNSKTVFEEENIHDVFMACYALTDANANTASTSGSSNLILYICLGVGGFAMLVGAIAVVIVKQKRSLWNKQRFIDTFPGNEGNTTNLYASAEKYYKPAQDLTAGYDAPDQLMQNV